MSAVGFLIWLTIALIVIRPIAMKRAWTLERSLTWTYFIAILPAGLVICPNFATVVSKETMLLEQVKALYYVLKYFWLLLPLGWAAGSWLARLSVTVPVPLLAARIRAYGLAATAYISLVPVVQQQYLVGQANEFSSVASFGLENILITLGIMVGSLILLAIAWPIAAFLSKRMRGGGLAVVWVLFVVAPFLPPISRHFPPM